MLLLEMTWLLLSRTHCGCYLLKTSVRSSQLGQSTFQKRGWGGREGERQRKRESHGDGRERIRVGKGVWLWCVVYRYEIVKEQVKDKNTFSEAKQPIH